MKKIISIVTLITTGLMSSAFASNDFTPFTTIEQAQQYCPATNGLIFIPNNPSIPNTAGSIKGINRIAFESIPAKQAVQPKNMDKSGIITDANFRSAEGFYGYISNNVITCLYTYKTIFNVDYNLAVRGK